MVDPINPAHVFPFDPFKPMSAKQAVDNVSQVSAEQAIGLIALYGSIATYQGDRIIKHLKNQSVSGSGEAFKQLYTAAHYNNVAMALLVQDLRAGFGPDTDADVIATVHRLAAQVETMQKALDASKPAAFSAAPADQSIETFLDSEGSGR